MTPPHTLPKPGGRLTMDEVLNLEHPTGEICRCPECEDH